MASSPVHGQVYTRFPGSDTWVTQKACYHPTLLPFRITLLIFNALITLGPSLYYDLPSVLEQYFETNDSDKDSLGLGPFLYNLLYGIYAWSCGISTLFGGSLVNYFGARKCVVLCTSVCFLGSISVVLGVQHRMQLLIFLGRGLVGVGAGSLTIAQQKMTSLWFGASRPAFLFTQVVTRIGPVISFFLLADFAESYGFQTTLWSASLWCCGSVVAALLVGLLDFMGKKSHSDEDFPIITGRTLSLSQVPSLPVSFWLLSCALMLVYAAVFPFIANSNQFLQSEFGFSNPMAARAAGVLYCVFLVAAPIVPSILTRVARRAIIGCSSALLMLVPFLLLWLTSVSPFVAMVLLGLAYTLLAACLWSAVPLVVEQDASGTAICVLGCLQWIATGLSSLVVGWIRSSFANQWTDILTYFVVNVSICALTLVVLNVVDLRERGCINGYARLFPERHVSPLTPAIPTMAAAKQRTSLN